jgi:arsenate reductase (thioredoxin)
MQMPARNFVFVCLHGSAKSLIAAEYLSHKARERGIDAIASSYGEEPDPAVPSHVVENMAAKGFDLRGRVPKAVSADVLANADEVITFGCDLTALLPPGTKAASWAACPAVSDGFPPAWDFITGSVDTLLERMTAAAR